MRAVYQITAPTNLRSSLHVDAIFAVNNPIGLVRLYALSSTNRPIQTRRNKMGGKHELSSNALTFFLINVYLNKVVPFFILLSPDCFASHDATQHFAIVALCFFSGRVSFRHKDIPPSPSSAKIPPLLCSTSPIILNRESLTCVLIPPMSDSR